MSSRKAPEPTRPLRILAHNAGLGFGGGEKAVLAILRGLADRGHEIAFLGGHAAVAQRFAAAGFPTRLIRIGGDVMLPHALRFAARIREHRPDIVLLTTFRKFLITGLGARLARAPRIIGRIGNETDLPDSAKYRFVFGRLLDAVMFNAESTRRQFLEVWPAFEAQRAVTILGGVAAPVVRAPTTDLRLTLGIAPGAPLIGTAGRLSKQKRFDRLLRATALLPDTHLVIAGTGAEEEPLRALIAQLGIGDRVHMIGYQDDLRPLFAALDVYVVSSDREGMSNAMLEAIGAGVPAVSTPVSGAAESLAPRPDGTRPGLVTRNFEPDVLRDAIAELLADPRRRAAMGAAGRARIAERFTYDRMIDEWERFLLELRGA